MKQVNLLTVYFSLIFCTTALAQLSPPGMGGTNTALWSAVGVKQGLNEKNTSMTYVGFGRISGANEGDPLGMPSIFVVNQEFYHKFSPDWKYSFAVSYRRQHEYDESYEDKEKDAINQEFRVYGRLQYTADFGDTKLTTTLRQEVRKFYTDNFAQLPNDFQLRTRLKAQYAVPLDIAGMSNLMGSAEALFAVSNDSSEGWGSMVYKETRFCLYYNFSPQSLPVAFDVGYMNDLIGHGSHTVDASYLAFDVIVKDPF